MVLSDADRRLVAEIQGGLPLSSHPYAEVGERIGMREQEVIDRIAHLQREGVIKRLGIVVRHHELGYTANAMVVWDVPDGRLDEVGEKLSNESCVTLCYQRPRCLPGWPYNLFSMIHGKDRQRVLNYIESIIEAQGLAGIPHKVLFSGRRFKQRGARYQ
ncbi:siroheme decarboxylase subunit beta [endosymbiont of Ridgeia piscesae]|jgi:DNA-binding Lrp family transcriptional regulator|uniref:siroheme decarboxylase n=1 Tax=endosymbiont of Ridgeia piscesae TaxID=54398 RepID=A0A0T5Z488_9GAMM|nr:Lrp/AsnC family transcriptional regulator [endosymbiont of Ridgeia piscesae]KRT53914.1 transcriptional regulator, AsnC family [endosymbiont of Ridgeia piscesae]KRT57703.1 transcriptional regulator, AsnC family [endosymbiont of Ridgeia piscesae]